MKTNRNTKYGLTGAMSAAGGAALALAMSIGHFSGVAGVETAIGNDVSSAELRAVTVESFDVDYSGGGYGWEVYTSKDRKEDLKENGYNPNYANLEVERHVKLIDGTPQDIRSNVGYDKAKVLAVQFAFSFQGNNTITIKPPEVDHYVVERPRPYFNEVAMETGKLQNRSCYKNPNKNNSENTPQRGQYVECVYGVALPGKVYQLSVWVLGRGNEYDMEAWIEDWKGATHILDFGSLDFVGWRPLTVKIPVDVPQDVESFPPTKTLVLKQFKIRARPDTSLEEVYLFFDEIRVLTDIFEVYFDGAQINFNEEDCERKNRAINILRQHARYPDEFRKPQDCTSAPGPANEADYSNGGPQNPEGGNNNQGGNGGN